MRGLLEECDDYGDLSLDEDEIIYLLVFYLGVFFGLVDDYFRVFSIIGKVYY